MGLPYLQSSIRELELPTDEPSRDSLMALSTGTRNHMRYSYGDLLMKGRRYGIVHRVWPGTQRLLLWGDPDSAAGYRPRLSGSGPTASSCSFSRSCAWRRRLYADASAPERRRLAMFGYLASGDGWPTTDSDPDVATRASS
jgi:hypothetical protein